MAQYPPQEPKTMLAEQGPRWIVSQNAFSIFHFPLPGQNTISHFPLPGQKYIFPKSVFGN